MPDLTIHDIPEDTFNKLQKLASRKGLSVETYAKEMIIGAIRFPKTTDELVISIDRFQNNVDLIFAAYGQNAIEVADARGRGMVFATSQQARGSDELNVAICRLPCMTWMSSCGCSVPYTCVCRSEPR